MIVVKMIFHKSFKNPFGSYEEKIKRASIRAANLQIYKEKFYDLKCDIAEHNEIKKEIFLYVDEKRFGLGKICCEEFKLKAESHPVFNEAIVFDPGVQKIRK